MPEVLTQTTQNTVPVVPVVQAPVVETPKEDLITRASKVSLEQPKKDESIPSDSISFNVKDLDKITDPVARKFAEDAYKSLQADYTRKTQAIANERKQVESLKAQLEASGKYTPERIQSMLNDPAFVQAAQEYQRTRAPQTNATNGELSEEEFSYLSPEQQKLYLKTKQMEQSNNAILAKLQASEVEKEDINLKTKYANYDPKTVNDIYNGMMNGTIQATREHLFKVADYDSAVQRAYQLGREDRKIELGEKVNANSPTNGVSVVASNDVPTRNQNESGVEYFKRIALHNFAKVNKK